MVILDPDRYGCTVWLINSPIIGCKNKVTHIKGKTSLETCKQIISRLAEYIDVKNQWGIFVERLSWIDDVYLDICEFGKCYKDIFRDYGLSVIDIYPQSPNLSIPKRTGYL